MDLCIEKKYKRYCDYKHVFKLHEFADAYELKCQGEDHGVDGELYHVERALDARKVFILYVEYRGQEHERNRREHISEVRQYYSRQARYLISCIGRVFY